MKTYASRSNAKRAAQQQGINEPDISVLEVSKKNAKELGLEEKDFGRFVWIDAGEKRRQREVEATIAELDAEQDRGMTLDVEVQAEDGPHKEELEQDREFEAEVDDSVPDEQKNTLLLNRNKSVIEEPVAYVHAMADRMNAVAAAAGEPAPRRKDVVNRCIEDGVAHHTARTQYQVWFRKQRQGAVRSDTPPAHLDHDAV